MEGAVFGCPARWEAWLPGGVRRLRTVREAGQRQWDVLALTASGWARLQGHSASCGVLLLPGDGVLRTPVPTVQTARAVSWGLSRRDSLTLSSISQPVLCVQRFLPVPDGTVVEPQEIPLPNLPAPAELLLPLLGLRLLFALPPVPPALGPQRSLLLSVSRFFPWFRSGNAQGRSGFCLPAGHRVRVPQSPIP